MNKECIFGGVIQEDDQGQRKGVFSRYFTYHKFCGLIKTSAHGTHCYFDQAEALQLDALKRFLRKSDSKWHFLYFFPLPHQHSSFRPSLGISLG